MATQKWTSNNREKSIVHFAGRLIGISAQSDRLLDLAIDRYNTTAYRCHVFITIANVHIQAVLSVILTFVPHKHVLRLNKHGNVNKSPIMDIHFLIAGLENKYFFG